MNEHLLCSKIFSRYQLEYKNQGYELPEKKYLELNANWMKRLSEAQRDHRYFDQVLLTLQGYP